MAIRKIIFVVSVLVTIGVMLYLLMFNDRNNPARRIEIRNFKEWQQVDFGHVGKTYSGAVYEFKAEVINSTDKVLNIETQKTCSCISMSVSPNRLLPGETGMFQMAINADVTSGEIKVQKQIAYIKARSEEGDEYKIALQYMLTIQNALDVTSRISFGWQEIGSNKKEEIVIKNITDKPIRISFESLEKPCFIVAAPDVFVLDPQRYATIPVMLSDKWLAEKSESDTLKYNAEIENCTWKGEIPISVGAMQPFSVKPPSLLIVNHGKEKVIEKKIQVVPKSEEALFEVIKIICDNELITVSKEDEFNYIIELKSQKWNEEGITKTELGIYYKEGDVEKIKTVPIVYVE